MKLNKLPELQRREFLRRASAVGLAGTAAPWAWRCLPHLASAA